MQVSLHRPDLRGGPWLLFARDGRAFDFVEPPAEVQRLVGGLSAWFEAEQRPGGGWTFKRLVRRLRQA